MKQLLTVLAFVFAAFATALLPLAVQAEDATRIIETWGYVNPEPATGAERGRQVYEQWCAICHEAGDDMAGTTGLERKYHGQVPALLREREDLTGAFVTEVIREGIASMPFYRKTEISDDDLTALIEYLVKNPAYRGR
ncbi:MAG: c-type cytochrome [Pseudomonadales bacterium]